MITDCHCVGFFVAAVIAAPQSSHGALLLLLGSGVLLLVLLLHQCFDFIRRECFQFLVLPYDGSCVILPRTGKSGPPFARVQVLGVQRHERVIQVQANREKLLVG